MKQHTAQHGLEVNERPSNGGSVKGVGSNPSTTSTISQVPIAVPGLGVAAFAGPVLGDRDAPALLGLHSLGGESTVLDLRPNKRHLYTAVSPGDIEIRLRLGAEGVYKLQMVQAPSGHFLIPCTAYGMSAAKHHQAFSVDR